MGETINGYRITTAFTNSNAGMCQWAFAQKSGHEYFIKQLLFPKYPTPATEKKLTPAIVNAMRAEADGFYMQRKRFFDKLLECRTGNVVVVQDFSVPTSSTISLRIECLARFYLLNRYPGWMKRKKELFLKLSCTAFCKFMTGGSFILI